MHLYLHIPFCHHICPYCGFYKHKPGRLANADFVDALLAEANHRTRGEQLPLKTIYWGGGTPTLLSSPLLRQLGEGLANLFDLSQLKEWTVEANPATFDLTKAELLRSLGVNRISLGVQSLQRATLATLGRDHSPDDATGAFQTLRDAGFENISIDLMFSIPGQTTADWQADLDAAMQIGPEHISAYNLTYEEDTEFLARHQSGQLDADEDRDADLFYQAIDTLEAGGYSHYEISNYARPGFESRHNRAYWSGADYLGLGPGAVSTIAGERSRTLADTAAYVRASLAGLDTRTEIELLDDEACRLELLAMQLRTKEGISLDTTGYGHGPNPIESLVEQGLVTTANGRLTLTRVGKALADPIAASLA